MPHSHHQRHTYKSNTHKNRSNLKTKYNDNKNNDQYLVCIPRLALPKEFLNDSNDSKLTMLLEYTTRKFVKELFLVFTPHIYAERGMCSNLGSNVC